MTYVRIYYTVGFIIWTSTFLMKATVLWYELQEDYYIPCLILSEEKTQPIGLRGQRHKQYLKEHKHFVYTTMLIDGTLNRYHSDINQQAEQMFHRLIAEMAQNLGVTKQLKVEQPMEWIGLMNNILACTREIMNNELIFESHILGAKIL